MGSLLGGHRGFRGGRRREVRVEKRLKGRGFRRHPRRVSWQDMASVDRIRRQLAGQGVGYLPGGRSALRCRTLGTEPSCTCGEWGASGDKPHVGIVGVTLHKTQPLSIIEGTNGCSCRLVWESPFRFGKQVIRPYAGTDNPGTRILLVKFWRETLLHTGLVPNKMRSDFCADLRRKILVRMSE